LRRFPLVRPVRESLRNNQIEPLSDWDHVAPRGLEINIDVELEERPIPRRPPRRSGLAAVGGCGPSALPAYPLPRRRGSSPDHLGPPEPFAK
jgi:hypothetical protein